MIEPILPMLVASLTLLIMAGLAGYAILVTPFLRNGAIGRIFSGLLLVVILGMGCLSGLTLIHYSLEARKSAAIAECLGMISEFTDKRAKRRCRDQPIDQIRRMRSS